MKKSVLIALLVVASGLLAACVGQVNLSAIAPQEQPKSAGASE